MERLSQSCAACGIKEIRVLSQAIFRARKHPIGSPGHLKGNATGFDGRKGPVNARAGGAHAPKLLNMSPNTFRCTGDKPQSFLSRIANDAGFWSGVSRTPNGTGREGTWQGGVRAGQGPRAGLGGGP